MKKQFTNNLQNKVKEFQETFGHPSQEIPTLIDIKRFTDRQVFLIEESVEGIHALAKDMDEFTHYFKHMMDGIRNAYHKQLEKKHPKSQNDKLVAIADAVVDGLYFKFGDGVELGVDLELVMNHVHNSNMSKLFEDENGNKYVKYREGDGKVLKSPLFEEPEPKIKEEIENQLKGSKGGYIVANLEVNDLIPKEVTVNKGEVILNKQDAKNIISQSNKKPSKKIKDSVEKVTSEQVKDVIESVLSNKDSE